MVVSSDATNIYSMDKSNQPIQTNNDDPVRVCIMRDQFRTNMYLNSFQFRYIWAFFFHRGNERKL